MTRGSSTQQKLINGDMLASGISIKAKARQGQTKHMFKHL